MTSASEWGAKNHGTNFDRAQEGQGHIQWASLDELYCASWGDTGRNNIALGGISRTGCLRVVPEHLVGDPVHANEASPSYNLSAL